MNISYCLDILANHNFIPELEGDLPLHSTAICISYKKYNISKRGHLNVVAEILFNNIPFMLIKIVNRKRNRYTNRFIFNPDYYRKAVAIMAPGKIVNEDCLFEDWLN